MSLAAPDSLGSKSLILHKGPALLESKVRLAGLNPQLPPVKASAVSLYSTYHHLRARPPAPSSILLL